MTLPQRDPLHRTYAEYLTWPEGGQYELIGGTGYIKGPPAPTPSHQELVGEPYHQLRLALEGTTAISAIPGISIDWDRLRATPGVE